MRECADCEYLRTINDPHPGALFCIKNWKQVLLSSICPDFKHAEPVPSTELASIRVIADSALHAALHLGLSSERGRTISSDCSHD